MQSRVRVIIEDSDSNISYSGYSYTVAASSTTDTTVYTAERQCIAVNNTVYVQYAFRWSPNWNWSMDFEEVE